VCTAALCIGLVQLGCASPEPRQDTPLTDIPAFSPSGENAPPDRWWTALQDGALDERIETALAGNFTLDEAWERIREARALSDIERSELLPTLDATADARVTDGSMADGEWTLGAGLEASYEVDLWGRIRAGVDAQRLRAASAALDFRAAAIGLSGEVAATWYRLCETMLELELIESQIRTNETVLEVLESRFAVGQSGSADVLRQRQLIEATREQAVLARAQADVLEHRLAVLEGRPPQGGAAVPTPALPELPALPATGLPAEVLQRRPDVRGALLRLEASDQEVAAAVRDQYPRLDLGAAVRSTADSPSGLLDAWIGTLAAQLVAPLYDGQRREAEIERRVAIRRGLLARYGQTVLDALAEVEDALAQERRQNERIERLESRLDLTRRTYTQLRAEYLNGAVDFIDVLTALEDQQQIQRDLLAARLDLVLFRIALHRAIAGGFGTPHEGARESVRESDRGIGDRDPAESDGAGGAREQS